MKKALQGILIGSMLLTTGQPGLAADAPASQQPRITVYVYNYAEVPGSVLDRARRQAAYLFARAGVEVLWRECPIGNAPGDPACTASPGANDIRLRILRRPKKSRVDFEPHTGGVAIRAEEDNCSGFVTLYYDRVEVLAEEFQMHPALILGHAAAHEIGHLLLPTGGHSSWGIMRAKLRPEEWQRAAKGVLVFSPEESEQLRARVLTRRTQ